MKRLIAIILICAFIGALAGCTGKPAGPEETQAPEVTREPYEEYDPPREDGTNRVIFYWYNETNDYDKCDMWIWFPNADGRGYLFHPCEYGAKVIVDVPQGTEEVGFIVRRECSDPGGTGWGDAVKDYDGDRFAKVTGDVTEVYLKPGDGAQYRSDDGGKTLYQEKQLSLAGIISLNEIKYTLSPATRITSLDQIKVTDESGRALPVESLSSLNNEVIFGVITLGEDMDLGSSYTLEIEGFEPHPVVPTEVFDSESFNEKYAYDGELGSFPEADGTEFRLWAPTASEVKLNLFASGDKGEAFKTLDMERGDKGVWSVYAEGVGHGEYYTYTVKTSLGTNELVDPYAKAVGVNGDRGMIVALAATDPEGWSQDTYYSDIDSYEEAVIWEVHVRDFSNKIDGAQYPGKYLAFTETGLKNAAGEPVGIDYLKDLGITHVHLQPVYDYATVDESSAEPQFNWGYDPKNYNAPEGSYSTDPYHGEVRLNEFKQMVMALHEAGIGVVMDVVYNHTYSADSCLGQAVPYYYYRYDGMGALSNGSGCGNETASERYMFRKYMVDSVSYWASEFHLDGFRFDLMALHDVETMQAVEQAVHAINPHALIYGEGWTGGTSALRENLRASQANITKIVPSEGAIGGVAVFNDTIRDGLKGSVFNAKDCGYISGKATVGTANSVIFGLTGGVKSSTSNWSVENSAVINYMACHDNNTIWDKLQLSNPDATDEERFLMNRLGIEIIMLAKGTPFFLAGEEMLRTKGGDSNSYNSSDEVNNIDWEALEPGSMVYDMRAIYRSLIAMRGANSFLTDPEVEAVCRVREDNGIEIEYMKNKKPVALAFINPNEAGMAVSVEAGLGVLLEGSTASASPIRTTTGSETVEGRSAMLLVMP